MPRYTYNHVHDTIDTRDWVFSSNLIVKSKLPNQFDLRTTGYVPPVLNQQSLGSCGATQISNALRFCLRKQNRMDFQPSRLFIYYFARLVDNFELDQDTGITIRGGLKAIKKYAACSEIWWPYIIRNFAIKPHDQCIKAASQHIGGLSYYSIPRNIESLKQALFNGFPIIIGIQIYESLESDKTLQTGIISIPDITKEKNYGGHCVALYGYDDSSKTFIMMNSWGTSV